MTTGKTARRMIAAAVSMGLGVSGLLAVAPSASASTCSIVFDGTTIATVAALQSALADAGDPGTGTCPLAGDSVVVTFTANLTWTTAVPLEWPSTYPASLTLQGDATLDAEGLERVLYVRSGAGTVTIDGLTITGGGKADYGAAVYSQRDLVIRDATFSANHVSGSGAYGGAVGSDSGAELTVIDSTFSGNGSANDDGGAIYWEGDVTITDSTFTSNTGRVGGAVYHSSGTLVASGSTWTGNSADNTSGGAIYSGSTSVLSISTSTFATNVADDFGGAIYNVGTATISDSTFDQNTSRDDHLSVEEGGGAIRHGAGTLTVTGSTFSGNSTLDFDGGAIHATTGGVVNIDSSAFRDNSADDRAGAIYSRDVTTVSGSTFSGNEGYYQGGAIFAVGSLAVSESAFTGNRSTGSDGGAIAAWGLDPLTVDSSQFSGNSGRSGGAIYLANGGSFLNSTVTGNTGVSGGGIYLASDAALSIDFVTLVSNSGSTAGANIFLADGAATPTVRGSVIGNPLGGGDNCSGVGSPWTIVESVADDSSCGADFTSATWAEIALGALADNGGPTQTMMPDEASVLVGFVTDGTATALTSVDQRGYARVDAYTAGAVEWSAVAPVVDAADLPPSWYQAYQRASADEECESGWDPSWAEWANDFSGGWTCERTIMWDVRRDGYVEESGFRSVLRKS